MQGNDKVIKTTVYFNNTKDDNRELVDVAEELGFSKGSLRELSYLGYEIKFEVEITEVDGKLNVEILKSPTRL